MTRQGYPSKTMSTPTAICSILRHFPVHRSIRPAAHQYIAKGYPFPITTFLSTLYGSGCPSDAVFPYSQVYFSHRFSQFLTSSSISSYNLLDLEFLTPLLPPGDEFIVPPALGWVKGLLDKSIPVLTTPLLVRASIFPLVSTIAASAYKEDATR